jgi:hypothetical protein
VAFNAVAEHIIVIDDSYGIPLRGVMAGFTQVGAYNMRFRLTCGIHAIVAGDTRLTGNLAMIEATFGVIVVTIAIGTGAQQQQDNNQSPDEKPASVPHHLKHLKIKY